MQDLRINEQRLWDTLMEMGDIGGTEKGGCNRLAGTDLDKQARDLFVSWCEALSTLAAYEVLDQDTVHL